MLQPTKEYVAVVDLERARWSQREALALQALAARPKKFGLPGFGRVLVWLGSLLMHAGQTLQLRYEASHTHSETVEEVMR